MVIQPQSDFDKEINRFFHKRLYLLFWVAIIFFPLFGVLDYYVVSDQYRLFFMLRMFAALSMIALLFILTRTGFRQHPFPVALTGLISCGGTVCAMVVLTGGYHSFYYVGMICVLVAFVSILPLTVYQSVGSGLLMQLLYIIPVMFFCSPEPGDGLIFFNNNFFFLFFVAISAVKSYEDYQARQEEFRLRKDLNYYAGNLEQEVRRRIIKQEESELKYKELYENIQDSLVLMDSNAHILIANPKFYKLTGQKMDKKKRSSFFEFVHPEDVTIVQEQMIKKLFMQAEIKNFQFQLLNREKQVYDMECSAKGLVKNGEIIGYQLVLRDISFRKKLERDLFDSFKTLENTRAATIMGLAKLTEYRDHETGQHLERIQMYAKRLAEELSRFPDFHNYIDKTYVEDLHLSSILHDIGKVGISDSILLKPRRLNSMEFEIIKKHCKYGGDALKAVESKISGKSFLTLGREIAYFHHEKWDGTGYPNGMKNSQIPLSARIVAVCDVYDALTSKRVYKKAYSHDTAVRIIHGERGKQFDPQVTDAFLLISDEFNRIRRHSYHGK